MNKVFYWILVFNTLLFVAPTLAQDVSYKTNIVKTETAPCPPVCPDRKTTELTTIANNAKSDVLLNENRIVTSASLPCPPYCPDKKPPFAYSTVNKTVPCPPACPESESPFLLKSNPTIFQPKENGTLTTNTAPCPPVCHDKIPPQSYYGLTSIYQKEISLVMDENVPCPPYCSGSKLPFLWELNTVGTLPCPPVCNGGKPPFLLKYNLAEFRLEEYGSGTNETVPCPPLCPYNKNIHSPKSISSDHPISHKE